MKKRLQTLLCAVLACCLLCMGAGATDWGLWYGNGAKPAAERRGYSADARAVRRLLHGRDR